MKSKEINNGWVVASMDGTFILPYTYKRTRKESIEKFMSCWDSDRCNWRKFKSQGYKCVKAKQTIELTQNAINKLSYRMKLELKHLAPYLHHKLKFLSDKHFFEYGKRREMIARGISLDDDKNINVEFLQDDELVFLNELKDTKPILRPLSDLKRTDLDIEGHEGYFHYLEEKYFTHSNDIRHLRRIVNEDDRWIYTIPMYLYEHLLEWHFDVFGLIPKGLAIDINTLND